MAAGTTHSRAVASTRGARSRAMATRRRYFDDSYAFESRSRVVRTRRASDGADDVGDGADDVVVVLDETIAYPAGGGQPCDRGKMTSATGATFAFERVRGLADGTIEHEGRF